MKAIALWIAHVLFLTLSAVRGAEHAERMMHATFKLYNKDSTATCFLLKDGDEVFAVSAAHTFQKATGDTSILVLRQPGKDGAVARKDVAVGIRKDGKALWTQHPTQDLAVLRLRLELPPAAAVPLSSVAAHEMPGLGDAVMLLTYPARVEANGAGFPLARQAVVASFPAAPLAKDPVFILDVTSWDGDSGGPVFRDGGDGQALILGVVIARINHVEEIKSERETRKIETAMGLSKALHASLILETIEKARGGRD